MDVEAHASRSRSKVSSQSATSFRMLTGRALSLDERMLLGWKHVLEHVIRIRKCVSETAFRPSEVLLPKRGARIPLARYGLEP